MFTSPEAVLLKIGEGIESWLGVGFLKEPGVHPPLSIQKCPSSLKL